MNTKNKMDYPSAIAKQMMEKLNIVYSLAINKKESLESIEKKFQEVLEVLDFYMCYDTQANQLINFSKLLFKLGNYKKSLDYAIKGRDKYESQDKIQEANIYIHEMSYKLLELGLISESKEDSELFLSAEVYLKKDDYFKALDNLNKIYEDTKINDEKKYLETIRKKLSFEILRIGMSKIKQNNISEGLDYLRSILPYLNEKRAAIIKKEINRLEGVANYE